MVARAALRARREALDLSQEGAALAVGVSTTTYRAWEAGTVAPRVARRRQLARVLKVSLDEIAGYFGDATGLSGHTVPRWFGHLASLEQGAELVQAFEPIVVHGLLQTEAYARAVESVGGDSGENVEQKVRVRLARQGVLTRMLDPLQLWVVLDESVLHRVAGGSAVMAEQLEQLATVGGRDNVTVQVIPMSAAVFRAAFGAFTLLTAPGDDIPYMGVVEDATGPHYLDRPPTLEAHVDLFGHLASAALPPLGSADLIRRTRKELYT